MSCKIRLDISTENSMKVSLIPLYIENVDEYIQKIEELTLEINSLKSSSSQSKESGSSNPNSILLFAIKSLEAITRSSLTDKLIMNLVRRKSTVFDAV